jgi:uncharacterized membrane protein (DUF373 family)
MIAASMTQPIGGSSGPTERVGTARRIDLRVFIFAERAVLSLVGAMFFIAAFALAIRAMGDLWGVIAGSRDLAVQAGTAFLDAMLLVLMLVELAYTVVTSFRGSELSAEPFLIVGLIAVIRRILVITIGSVNLPGSSPPAIPSKVESFSSQPVELIVLTAIVLVFVGSIALLRMRHAGTDDRRDLEDDEADPRWN